MGMARRVAARERAFDRGVDHFPDGDGDDHDDGDRGEAAERAPHRLQLEPADDVAAPCLEQQHDGEDIDQRGDGEDQGRQIAIGARLQAGITEAHLGGELEAAPVEMMNKARGEHGADQHRDAGEGRAQHEPDAAVEIDQVRAETAENVNDGEDVPRVGESEADHAEYADRPRFVGWPAQEFGYGVLVLQHEHDGEARHHDGDEAQDQIVD